MNIPVFLSLGSNLGDRLQYLTLGARALARRGVIVKRSSPVYETQPRIVTDQPWFLNAAVEVECLLDPRRLLNTCMEIEREHGRERKGNRGPRTLDIDVLFFGDQVIHTPELTIPHAGVASRRFVLEPLAQLAPDWIDPVTGKSIRELLDELRDDSVVRLFSDFPVR